MRPADTCKRDGKQILIAFFQPKAASNPLRRADVNITQAFFQDGAWYDYNWRLLFHENSKRPKHRLLGWWPLPKIDEEDYCEKA